jgi:hypothetical protein
MIKKFVIVMLTPLESSPGLSSYAIVRVSRKSYNTYEKAEEQLLRSKLTLTGMAYSVMPIYVKSLIK